MKKLLILLVLLGAALVAGAYYLNRGPRAAGPSQFTYQPIERGTLIDAVSATGVLQPRQIAAVSSELPGLVAAIDPKADFNQPVKKGQPLAYLDKKLYQQKLAQAETAITAAQADVEKADALRSAAEKAFKRAKELPAGVGFSKDLDQAEAQLKAADATISAARAVVKRVEASRDEAQTALDKTVLTSPIDGVIIDKKIVLGQAVAPTLPTPLFTIAADLKDMDVHAQVSEGDVGKVRQGQKARFTVNAYPDTTFTGTVREIRLTPVLAGAVFYIAVVEVENRKDKETGDWQLRPGMPAAVDVIRREHTEAWKVPSAAVSLVLDPHYQTEAARKKLADWQARSDSGDWRPVWILGPDQHPWPMFIRVGADAIQDSQYTEVQQWDPELKLDPQRPDSWPRLIINAPPVEGKSLTDFNVRVF